jgi:hypothetical protein
MNRTSLQNNWLLVKHWTVSTFADELLVPEGIICPVISVSVLTSYIMDIYSTLLMLIFI